MATIKITRNWKDLSKKLVLFAISSLSATVIITIGSYLGFHIPLGLAAFIASAAGIVGGYLKSDTVVEGGDSEEALLGLPDQPNDHVAQ